MESMDYELVELVQPRYGSVNAYRIGDTLVDSGHVCPASQDRLWSALDDGLLQGIERVVLTHPHIDHVGGSMTVPLVTDLPHVVFGGADEVIRDYPNYVAAAREEMADLVAGLLGSDGRQAAREGADPYFPLDIEYAQDAIDISRVVSPNERVRIGAYECTVVHTPGHCRQHMALYHEPTGVMLSGDIVSTNGHFMYGPIHWDIGEYKTGLRRIRDRGPDLLLPGHGEPMDDPAARVGDALAKAERAESSILNALDRNGELAAHELAREALDASDSSLPFLTNVASAYAVHLADKGLIEVDRRPDVVARPA